MEDFCEQDKFDHSDRIAEMLRKTVEERYKKVLETTRARQSELEIKQVLRDGHCLFRAIAYVIFFDQERYMDVRRLIVSEVALDLQEYINFFDEKNTCDDWCDVMKKKTLGRRHMHCRSNNQFMAKANCNDAQKQ